MAKFPWQKDKEGVEAEFTLPDELTKQIKDGAEAAAKVTSMQASIDAMKSIMENDAKERKTEREAAAARAAAAAAAQRNQQQQENNEELEGMFLTDPVNAVKKLTDPLALEVAAGRADNIRRETFEDQEKFPYYHGDIKREVDSLIAGQHVSFRLNPANIENAYNTVLGKHTGELLEGKLKKRFAGGENGNRGTSTGSAGSSGTGGKEEKTFDAETMKHIEKAAKVTGITTKDYIEMLDKEGVI